MLLRANNSLTIIIYRNRKIRNIIPKDLEQLIFLLIILEAIIKIEQLIEMNILISIKINLKLQKAIKNQILILETINRN